MHDAAKLLLTEREAADRLSVSAKTLSRLRKRRLIPYLPIGTRAYYRVADLEAWAEAQLVTGGQSHGEH